MSLSTLKPLLEVQGLTRYFGGLLAVDQVSFAVQDQEIFGLIGLMGREKLRYLI